jgi:transketolase
MATIKPLDTEALAALAAQHDAIVTVEEHQINGGLGSAVAEFLSETNPTKMARIGIHDQFGQSGEPDELIAHYGMDVPSIVAAAQKLIQN